MFILKQHLSLVLALIFAVLASVGLYRFLENRESVAHAEPTAVLMGSVVVAKHDLAMGSRLTEENMAIQSWPKEVISERNFSSLEPLVGRTLRSNLIADEPIMSGKILKVGENISSLIPPNMRVIGGSPESLGQNCVKHYLVYRVILQHSPPQNIVSFVLLTAWCCLMTPRRRRTTTLCCLTSSPPAGTRRNCRG